MKLLRVLQEREFEPLGSTKSVKMKARVIASTNCDLSMEVQKKHLREDLYFRLNMVRISLPPLRDRMEDIPLLVHHFIHRFNVLQGRRVQRCSERVLALFMKYSFPGNIPELENVIEHGVVVCTSSIIQFADLPPHIMDADTVLPGITKNVDDKTLSSPLQNAESDVVRAALIANNWNKQYTAASLGISRNTL